ncbi:DDE-type integrase/transposase/recombinase [Corynebacterium auris]|uniref:DDE-type integrase/transposase/recombinase n=1 Tax=Corynebacterium auris TaxID=44750 RepID=UPI00338DCCCA
MQGGENAGPSRPGECRGAAHCRTSEGLQGQPEASTGYARCGRPCSAPAGVSVVILRGRRHARASITPRRANVPDCRPDPVNRGFTAQAPHRLWVAAITYVCTLLGFGCTAFVTDAYSRAIAGVATRASMRTDELLLELFHAGVLRAKGLIHHEDRGFQYVPIRYGEALGEAGIEPSISTVGDSYDNALVVAVNGLHKTGPMYAHRWWASLGYITPQETGDSYCQHSDARWLGV